MIMNKYKKIICFIAGPFHIICLNEYLRKNKLLINKLEIYYIHNSNFLVTTQVLNTFNFYGFKQYKILNISNNIFIKFFQFLFFNLKLKIQNKNSEDLIFLLIDFKNSFLHSFRSLFLKSKFILIDDGSSTYMEYQRYIVKGYYLPFKQYQDFRGKFFKYIFYRSNFRRLLFIPFDIFTIYARELNLSHDCLNNLSYLKNKILNKNNKKISFNNNLVFFSGTKLSERGAMPMDIEVKLLINLKNYWKNKRKDMIYVTKRTTSIEKIKLLEKNKINCISFDLPLEIAMSTLDNRRIPRYFCSFGSTLDQSLKMIYPGIKIYLVVFDIKDTRKDLKSDLKYSKELTEKSNYMNIINISL